MTIKKVHVSWQDIEKQVQELTRQLLLDQWIPDYVVGITRGGLVPANMLSQYLNCRMETLQVRLRDGVADETCESNLWMSEEAFGYVSPEDRATVNCRWDPSLRKKILIVDDINDSGATLNWIKNDWQRSCLPEADSWNTVWGNNVRVAVLYDNEASDCSMDINYSAVSINKFERPEWIVFPWEDYWCRQM